MSTDDFLDDERLWVDLPVGVQLEWPRGDVQAGPLELGALQWLELSTPQSAP